MLKTGKITQLGKEVRIGDILKGSQTHHMLVILNTEFKSLREYIVAVVDYQVNKTTFGSEKLCNIRDLVFSLDEIINTWSDLEVVDNIILR